MYGYEGRLGGESWIKNAGRKKTDTGQDGQVESGEFYWLCQALQQFNISINGNL